MALSKLAVRRLTKLADYMASLPRSANKHFSMTSFVCHHGEHEHAVPETPEQKDLLTCGTTACAAGWAATVPSFRKAGYRLKVGRSFFTDKPYLMPFFGNKQDGAALERFFELDRNDIRLLFGGDQPDKTPKKWANRCRKFIEANS